MDLGIVYFPTDTSISPVDAARLAERLGFSSLYVTEHTHIPVAHSPYPAGGPLPEQYRRTWDPFVALSAAAAVTDTLRLGTGICLIAQHDPIVAAKATASLQLLSGGRFSLGVGAGWNEPETANHGTDPRQRFAVMREHVQAMQTIWNDDEASYDGAHVRFAPLWSWPKPPGGIEVLVGGLGATVLERVLDYGDGWLPIVLGDMTKLAGRVSRLREQAAAQDRPRPRVVGYWPSAMISAEGAERLVDVGLDEVLLELPAEAGDASTERMERWAEEMLG